MFADVHFALFYTAILHAFQSVLVAYATTRVTQKLWVQTESLELNHYVEIREEFEEVKKKLTLHSMTTSSSGYFDAKSVFKWMRYPVLRRKYLRLLLQVRFHELRVHFLEAYQLPLKLKVSDYLVRSKQNVLLKLVQVSSVAWLLLTGAINVVYYGIGMISYHTRSMTIMGDILIVIFFSSMGVFVVVSLVVYVKMDSIFKSIMLEKTLWDVNTIREGEREMLADQQRALFWGRDPTLVIAAIQFMQFGYAVCLSVLIIYWKVIEQGHIYMWLFPVSIAGCYSAFVIVTAHVLPQYTLCTSLGQLVDEQRLHETLADFELEQAKHEFAKRRQLSHVIDKTLFAPESTGKHEIEGITASLSREPSRHSSFDYSASELSDPLAVDKEALMLELVKLDTASLRTNLPQDELTQLSSRQLERATMRANRRKTRSEGVKFMASMKNLSDGRRRETRKKTLSAGAAEMKLAEEKDNVPAPSDDDEIEITFSAEDLLSESTAMVNDDSGGLIPTVQQSKSRPRHLRASGRKKSVSDGVALMSRIHEITANSLMTQHAVVEEDSDDEILLPLEQAVLPAMPSKGPVPSVSELPSTEAGQLETDCIHSTASDDGLSDKDDIPDVDFDIEHVMAGHTPSEHVSFSLKLFLMNYFASRKFVLISNVFGTMMAFYFVGKRVEKFLHTEGVISEKYVSFGFSNRTTFWGLMLLFIAFLGMDVMILTLFVPLKKRSSFTERKVVVAAILDLALCACCLTCLIIGEVRRCCRISTSLVDEDYKVVRSTDRQYLYEQPTCSCPAFGSRLYGGLGNIEPFMSLVALRVFRHYVAKRLVVYFSKKTDDVSEGKKGLNLHPFDVFGGNDKHDHSHSHGHGHDNDKSGTAAELWKATVSKHPEIVAKYGEFSSEVLQAMLGLYVDMNDPAPHVSRHGEWSDDHGDSPHIGKFYLEPHTSIPRSASHNERQQFVLGIEYSALSKDAQAIILAGKLGRPVRFSSIMGSTDNESVHPSIPEDEEHNPRIPTSLGRFLFELDTTPMDVRLTSVFSVLTSPEALIVRSMRRCDRKLLPILDAWSVVDVVMTQTEIVYFDANYADKHMEESESVKGILEAVVATKGGKGLRLCDVAAHRRIVGHLELAEIESITVERVLPSSDDVLTDSDETEDGIINVEWWKGPTHQAEGKQRLSRSERWSKVKEDRLRIQATNDRILYLRFYSDLEDAEHHLERLTTENDIEGDLVKNNALQWAQTIVRFLGPDRLQQSLPHFGDGTVDELRDYLVVYQHSVDAEVKVSGGPMTIWPLSGQGDAGTFLSLSQRKIAHPEERHATRSDLAASGTESRAKNPIGNVKPMAIHKYTRSSSVGEIATSNVLGQSSIHRATHLLKRSTSTNL